MVTGRNQAVVVNSVTGYGSPKCANTGSALYPLVIARHITCPTTLLLTLLLVVVVLPLDGLIYLRMWLHWRTPNITRRKS